MQRENMKIVFLDVDGELTYSDYENAETANIDIEKVKLLYMDLVSCFVIPRV